MKRPNPGGPTKLNMVLATLQVVAGVASLVILTVFVSRNGTTANSTAFLAIGLVAANGALVLVRYGLANRKPERPQSD